MVGPLLMMFGVLPKCRGMRSSPSYSPRRIPEIARAPIDVGPRFRLSLGRGAQTGPPQTGGHHRCRGNTACELVHADMDIGTSYVLAQQTLVLR